jgi:hypothetical protein
MKKSTLTALILGIISGLLFSIGMCMVLLPEWNLFVEGIGVGIAGMILGLITVFIWQMMAHDRKVKWSAGTILLIISIIVGSLALGISCVLLSHGVEALWELLSFFRGFFE